MRFAVSIEAGIQSFALGVECDDVRTDRKFFCRVIIELAGAFDRGRAALIGSAGNVVLGCQRRRKRDRECCRSGDADAAARTAKVRPIYSDMPTGGLSQGLKSNAHGAEE